MDNPREFMVFEEWIEGLIAEGLNVKRDSVNPATRINDRLGVDGDDAYKLLEMLAERTGAAYGEDFEYHRYFGNEPNIVDLFGSVAQLFSGRRVPRVWLTVRQLAVYLWEHGGKMPVADPSQQS